MRKAAESSLLALALRAGVLLGLIAQAAWLYARLRLSARGVRPLAAGEREARLRAFAARFVAAATRFRGGLIKLGQVASLRLEVLPEAITKELSRLQDRVAPHPFAEITARIEHEYGVPWPERLADLASEPIAAASLGQVHEARARDGRHLAIKVLYPGIERSVAVDLAMARPRAVAVRLGRDSGSLRGVPPAARVAARRDGLSARGPRRGGDRAQPRARRGAVVAPARAADPLGPHHAARARDGVHRRREDHRRGSAGSRVAKTCRPGRAVRSCT
jgi:hypothetical protein